MRSLGCVFIVCALSHYCHALPAAKTCRAVAFSGGGDKGAYEAGVIKGLTSVLPKLDTTYDVVTGISAGSILTAASGIYAVGDEAAMADFLVNTTLSLSKATIYRNWPGGLIEGLTLKSGLYDSTPEREFIGNVIKKGFKGRKLVIGATSDTSGMLHTWNETQWQSPDGGDFLDGVMASSAIPGIFPSVKWGGETFSDGGTTMGVNVFDAIVRCREVTTDENIIVDVIATAGEKIAWSLDAAKDTTLTVMMRNNDIKKVDALMHDVYSAKTAYPNVQWRYLIYPSSKLPGNGLNFDPKEMQSMVDLGMADAATAVKAQPRVCSYETADVPCTEDQDCLNWVAAKCQTMLPQKYCKPNRFCHFGTQAGR